MPGRYQVTRGAVQSTRPERPAPSAVSLYLEPGHHPPRRAAAASPRREARAELKPPAAFRVASGRTQLRRPRPGSVGDLDPDGAVCGDDRDHLPGSTRPAVPDTGAEDLADHQDGHVPARVPGAEYLKDECPGAPRPLRPPSKRHALPDHTLAITAPVLPGRPAPGTRLDSGRSQDMHAQLCRELQVGTTGLCGPLSVTRPWSRPPSVAVRAKPTVPRTAPRPPFSSAMRPWTPQHRGSQRNKMTHPETKKKRPA
jgi:hypothetical protein